MTQDTSALDPLAEIQQPFSGKFIEPGDDSYEMITKAYALAGASITVVRPENPAEVASAIRYAREQGLDISVRSGGHGAATFVTDRPGLVIDLSAINDIEIVGQSEESVQLERPVQSENGESEHLVRIGAGCTWGAVAETLAPHGLALSSGDTTSVGVGGLTLGGGVGWMVRQHGLALDSLVAAEVVLADSSIVRTGADQEPDLFWALRGGGGNFGIVTHFVFRAHPLPGIVGGSIHYDPEDLGALLKGWRDAMRASPEQLNTTFLGMPAFGDMPAGFQVAVCYGGDDEQEAMAAVAPLLDLAGFREHDILSKAYAGMLEEPHPPEGEISFVMNNGLVPDFSDELIAQVSAAHRAYTGSVLMIRYLSGAFNRVPEDATAFGYRDAEVLLISVAFLPPGEPPETEEGIRERWEELAGSTRGSYGNFVERVAPELLPTIYPPRTIERLLGIKRRYDPDNVFRQNHNLVP